MRTALLTADAKPAGEGAAPDFVIETLADVLTIVTGA
jgi:hypothetical protein